jgi:hypothetical protein
MPEEEVPEDERRPFQPDLDQLFKAYEHNQLRQASLKSLLLEVGDAKHHRK